MTSEPRSTAVHRRVFTNGLTLAVTEYPADGPALLLLHGIGSRGLSWWPVIDALAPRFRLFVPDLRGHGDSDKPPAGYLIDDYARDLAGLIDALGLARPLIVGHSLGGVLTLRWAMLRVRRAARIVLEDTALRSGPRAVPLLEAWLALASMTPREAAEFYKAENPDWSDEDCQRRAESITSTHPAVFVELRDANLTPGADADRIAPLAVIASPTLLVHGDPASGSLVVPADAACFGATLPNARVVRIPGGTHSLHRDNTQAFLDVVVPFLLEETD